MITRTFPSPVKMDQYLLDEDKSSFAYEQVGDTRPENFDDIALKKEGYDIDHSRVELGHGEEVYRRAVMALRRWKQFDLPWVRLWRPDKPVEDGTTIAVCFRLFGLWWLNASRVVYTLEQETDSDIRASGFAYGSLDDHVEKGEERFLIEWDTRDGAVFYEILAFSRPNRLFARLGYPVARHYQRRFVRDSQQAMLQAVAEESA